MNYVYSVQFSALHEIKTRHRKGWFAMKCETIIKWFNGASYGHFQGSESSCRKGSEFIQYL